MPPVPESCAPPASKTKIVVQIPVDWRVVFTKLQALSVYTVSLVVVFERTLGAVRIETKLTVDEIKAMRDELVLASHPAASVGVFDARRNLHAFAGQPTHFKLVLHAKVRRILESR